MGIEFKVTVGDLQGKLRLKARGHTRHEVQLDYFEPFGDDDGFTGLEMLLASLAGCSGHTILLLLGKMDKKVKGLEIQAVGKRRDEHPAILTHIELQYNLQGENLDQSSVEKAIASAEEKYCPVWAMLRNNTVISWKCSVNKGERK